jgi:diaminohydroxyphosphoribosylaminopyrimidine deaminase / 5-amino-6-(5-phosphoribosylamino)uracil reductase
MTSASSEDRRYIDRTLVLARQGWGRVHPNPMVGAVVVKDGEVAGEGFHAEYGGPHAEIQALRAAGDRARGATLYISLEPCNHSGKTPPCTDAILAAGIAHVVFAVRDPDPVAKGGADKLRAAGVEVTGDIAQDAARALNAIFFHAKEQRATFVALKYGLTLDARLSATTGMAGDVTGPAAREDVQRLRAGFDAILVGTSTVAIDDPQLTVRGVLKPKVPPVRIVVDTRATLNPKSRLVQSAREVPVWLFCSTESPAERRDRLRALGVRVIELPHAPGGVDLHKMIELLWSESVRSVLCEGGGRIGSALLLAHLVQRMHLYYAPRVFGNAGVVAFDAALPDDEWKIVEVQRLDEDVLLTLDRVRSASD